MKHRDIWKYLNSFCEASINLMSDFDEGRIKKKTINQGFFNLNHEQASFEEKLRPKPPELI